MLSFSEFSDLVEAFGNEVAVTKVNNSSELSYFMCTKSSQFLVSLKYYLFN